MYRCPLWLADRCNALFLPAKDIAPPINTLALTVANDAGPGNPSQPGNWGMIAKLTEKPMDVDGVGTPLWCPAAQKTTIRVISMGLITTELC
jgi:hypothetical protein